MSPSAAPVGVIEIPTHAVEVDSVVAHPIEVTMLGLGVVGTVRHEDAARLAKRVLLLSQVLVVIQLILAVVAIVRKRGLIFVLIGLSAGPASLCFASNLGGRGGEKDRTPS